MIILSLNQKTLSGFKKAVSKNLESADLFELRLDLLSSFSYSKIEELIKTYPILITLRSKEEGGDKVLSLFKRSDILKKIILLKPKYLDLEFARDKKLLKFLEEHSPKTKLILSYHSLDHFLKNLESQYLSMSKYKAWKHKIACPAFSDIQCLKMLLMMKKYPDFIGICMGDKGKITRVLGPVYNQKITYCSLHKKETAQGQLNLKELSEFYNYRSYNKKTKVLGIIGNPLWQSPGFKTYNSLFLKEGMNAVYFNFEIEKNELDEFLRLAHILKFQGLSVTIPFKEKVVGLINQKDPNQKDIGSINSILFKNSIVYGANTDGQGALEMLEQHEKMLNKKVLIVGAGGTAYGMGYVLKNAGAKVLIMNRTDSKALKLAKKLGAEFKPFDQIKNLTPKDYDLLIHTTPVGNENKNECLIPQGILFPKKIIFDVIFNKAKLLKLAEKKECQIFTGKEFWIWQAYLQCKLWFKNLPDNFKDNLRKHMP